MFETKKQKLAQYGKRIFNLIGSDDQIAHQAIEQTILFFQKMGMETKISDCTNDFAKAPAIIEQRFIERGWKALGEQQNVTPQVVRDIVTMSF